MNKNFYASDRFVLLLCLCWLFTASVSAQTPQEITAKVDEYMTAANRVDRFSGTILVARNGQPVVSKGYGLANAEFAAPNTPTTVFRIGSITKQFTATAIMILQERGKLSVSDPVCKYVTDCPAAWQPITIKNLLTHTSGIPNYTAFPDFGKVATLPMPTAELLARYKDKPLDFAVGEKYAYSNSGYHLLGIIIEQTSGKTYADFLQENIFTPLGMKQTGYDNPARVVKNRAAGYAWRNDEMANAAYMDMTIPYSAGALSSTVEDLLIWDQALYTEKLVSRKTLDEMFTPFKNDYGYGWSLGKRLDHKSIAHGGNIYGFASYISRYPDDRLTVIVLSNNEGAAAGDVATDLAAIVFNAPYKIPRERKAIAVDAKTLEKYVGQYQLLPNIVMTVTLENGKLLSQIATQPKMELFAESETDFFLKAVNWQFTFVNNAEGAVTGLVWHQGRRDSPAQKIK